MTSDYQRVIDHYSDHKGAWVDHYDRRFIYPDLYLRRNQYVEKILRQDDQAGSKRCLDFGCGYGDVTIALAPLFREIHGVDIVPNNIEQAARNAAKRGVENVRFSACTERLPYDDGYFDYVLLLDVFEHFHEPDRLPCLQEVRRVLKKSGVVIVITPDRKIISLLEKFDNLFLFFLRQKSDILHNPLNHFLAVSEMKDCFVRARFALSAVDRICFYPAPETWGFFYKINKAAVLAGLGRPFNAVFRWLFYRVIEPLKVLNQKVVYIAHQDGLKK